MALGVTFVESALQASEAQKGGQEADPLPIYVATRPTPHKLATMLQENIDVPLAIIKTIIVPYLKNDGYTKLCLKKMAAVRSKTKKICDTIEEGTRIPRMIITAITLPYLRDGFILINSFDDSFTTSEDNSQMAFSSEEAITIKRECDDLWNPKVKSLSATYDICTGKLLAQNDSYSAVPKTPRPKKWRTYPSPSGKLITTMPYHKSLPSIQTSINSTNLLRDTENELQPFEGISTWLVAYSPHEDTIATYSLADYGGSGAIDIYKQLDEDIVVQDTVGSNK